MRFSLSLTNLCWEDKVGKNSSFWDKYAAFYDFEINLLNKKAYQEMYNLMTDSLSKEMNLLEVATGTGLVALNISEYVKHIEAIDFSMRMIKKAKKKRVPANICFSVADAMNLPYEDDSFDACIISNALHIMSEPEIVLENISRVLKPNGLLIAPTYTHGHLSDEVWERNAKTLKFFGLGSYPKRTPNEYVEFIQRNGFNVLNHKVLDAAFPLVYLEALNSK